MKVVNPIGRIAGEQISANSVRACMCGDYGMFAAANTTADTCAHCGCNCSQLHAQNTTNYGAARGTNRTSHL